MLILQGGGNDLVKLWGEDALLDWPGALTPVIHERDAYMAKTILAAVQGTALLSCPPYGAIVQHHCNSPGLTSRLSNHNSPNSLEEAVTV